MKHDEEDHNQGLAAIASDSGLTSLWHEFLEAIDDISEPEIIYTFNNQKRKAKSISEAINKLLDEKLTKKGWDRQSPIYKDKGLSGKTWTLDFSKGVTGINGKESGIPVEVVFNHGEAIAWNLIKLSLATENNVQKQFQFDSSVGVYVCASKELKDRGGFDGAIGHYEKVIEYLKPLDQKMIKPLVVLQLSAPETFYIERYPNDYHVAKLRGRSTGKLKLKNQ
jgi:hypothetical protein